MMFYKSKDFCMGLKVEIDNQPYTIIENKFISPGKGKAFNKLKLKNVINKSIIQKTIKIGTKLKSADIIFTDAIYLYNDQDIYFFINIKTKEYHEVLKDILLNEKKWLKEGLTYSLISWNKKIIAIKPPKFIELKVLSVNNVTEGTMTAKNLKHSMLETGISIKVPLFIKNNDIIKIDTEQEAYVARMN